MYTKSKNPREFEDYNAYLCLGADMKYFAPLEIYILMGILQVGSFDMDFQ